MPSDLKSIVKGSQTFKYNKALCLPTNLHNFISLMHARITSHPSHPSTERQKEMCDGSYIPYPYYGSVDSHCEEIIKLHNGLGYNINVRLEREPWAFLEYFLERLKGESKRYNSEQSIAHVRDESFKWMSVLLKTVNSAMEYIKQEEAPKLHNTLTDLCFEIVGITLLLRKPNAQDDDIQRIPLIEPNAQDDDIQKIPVIKLNAQDDDIQQTPVIELNTQEDNIQQTLHM